METRILLKTDIIISEELQDTRFSSMFLSPFGSTLFHLCTHRMVTVCTETKALLAYATVSHTQQQNTHTDISRKFNFYSVSRRLARPLVQQNFMLKVELIDSVMIINRFFFNNTSLCPLTKQE